MATNYNDLVQNTGGIYTNPSDTGSQITDEFVDPPSSEKSNRATGVRLNKKQSTQDFFANLYTSKIPTDQNSLDAAVGFLVKKGFSKKTADPIASQILAIAYYSKKPVWYWLDELSLLPNTTDINLKILQILNASGNGNFYLGLKSNSPANAYVSRLLIK